MLDRKIIRTPQEIADQIAGLKAERESLPQFGMFGDNWSKIDAQIAVLEGRHKPDHYYMDEHAEEFEDGDNEDWSAACSAEDWLTHPNADDLF